MQKLETIKPEIPRDLARPTKSTPFLTSLNVETNEKSWPINLTGFLKQAESAALDDAGSVAPASKSAFSH